LPLRGEKIKIYTFTVNTISILTITITVKIIIIILIQLNSYLFTCKLNSQKANYKVSTSKEKETDIQNKKMKFI
jgi:hypothetical protein